MNDFFTNLIDRHLGTCETIQPRTLGRFEVDRNSVTVTSPDKGINPVISESEQTLQPPTEAPYELPKKTASKINPLESTAVKSEPPIDTRGAFVEDTPKETIHESEPNGGKNEYPSPSLLEQSASSALLGLTEQQAALYEPHVLPTKKQYHTQPLETDRSYQLETLAQEQLDEATPVVNEYRASNDGYGQTNINELHKIIPTNPPPPSSRTSEHYPENQLNHRIHTMLQHLAGDPVSPIIEPSSDNRGSNKDKNQISNGPENKSPLLDTTIASLEATPGLKQPAGHQDSFFADDGENTALNSQLEPPSWLPDMESQFNRRLQEKETKTEPVINVTIGRVEVRAVQTEAPKNVQHPKKPTGVMTLDEYLNRREGRGSK